MLDVLVNQDVVFRIGLHRGLGQPPDFDMAVDEPSNGVLVMEIVERVRDRELLAG